MYVCIVYIYILLLCQILSTLLEIVNSFKLKVLFLQSNWFVEHFRYHSPVI